MSIAQPRKKHDIDPETVLHLKRIQSDFGVFNDQSDGHIDGYDLISKCLQNTRE
ncbi:MAG TPA: hypothetical protein VK503_01585 [Candidatus Bathyarchaeia archaeon]|nr:hypothetical protein [Candidatus Bathyarchaeia archaeon]